MLNDQRRARSGQESRSTKKLWAWGAGATVATLAASAVYNQRNVRRAESDNPPVGEFVDVDGVRLHYLEAGEGPVILLLHGNGAMIEDWLASGVFDALSTNHRVIAFDRPGFGHSDRPRSTVWSAPAQAKLIAQALDVLGIEKPLVVGHSWGASVALAMAVQAPERLAGVTVVSGYYYPTARADVLFAAQPAIPVIGDLMRHTVSPLLGAALSPVVAKKVFGPAPVPESFAQFPMEMALRPSQIRAEAAESALMIPGAVALSKRYAELDLPITIVAGSGDQLIDPQMQACRLADALPQAKLRLIDGSGHMVHYTATDEVVQAIEEAWPHQHG